MSKFLNPNRKTPFGEPEETICDTWPAPGLVAREGDPIGAAIIEYRDRWAGHPDFPEAPWDPRRGEINLRDLNAPAAAEDEPPRYRLKAFAGVNGVLYSEGAEITFEHWLNRNNSNLTSTLEPINDSARLVHAYTLKFLNGRQMPGLPFSLGKLTLPNPALFGKPQPETHRENGMSANGTKERAA